MTPDLDPSELPPTGTIWVALEDMQDSSTPGIPYLHTNSNCEGVAGYISPGTIVLILGHKMGRGKAKYQDFEYFLVLHPHGTGYVRAEWWQTVGPGEPPLFSRIA